MNRLTIIGKLTKNPRCRLLENNGPPRQVCDFTVAVAGKKDQAPVFFRVSCYDAKAAECMTHLRRGSIVAVVGPVTARAYLGANGEPQASLDVQAEEIEIMSVKILREEEHHA